MKVVLELNSTRENFRDPGLISGSPSIVLYWLVGMLLVSRSGLVEDDAVEVFHYYGFHLSSSFLM